MLKESQKNRWTAVAVTCESCTLNDLLDYNFEIFFDHLLKMKKISSYLMRLDFNASKLIVAVIPDPSTEEQPLVYLTKTIRDLYSGALLKTTGFENMGKDFRARTIECREIEFTLKHNNLFAKNMNYHLGKELSDIIINVLSNTLITDKSLLMCSIYLHLGWIKARYLVDKEPIEDIILKGYYGGLSRIPETEKILDSYDRIFEQNQSLHKLYPLIISSNDSHKVPVWVQNWINLCCSKLRNNASIFEENPALYDISHYTIPDLINEQLGLAMGVKIVQNYFLEKMFVASGDLMV